MLLKELGTRTLGYRYGSAGMGCAGEPPGHPRYYVRPIYNSRGDSLPDGQPQYFLPGVGYFDDPDVSCVDAYYGSEQYPKEPMGTERWKAWEMDRYRHLNKCYERPEDLMDPKRPWDKLWTYTMDGAWKKRKMPENPDGRFTEEWMAKLRTEVEEHNRRVDEEIARVMVPEKHMAVILIRRHYPEYQPNLGLIEKPNKYPEGWWTTSKTRPSEAECPGDVHVHLKHSEYCQWCGNANYR